MKTIGQIHDEAYCAEYLDTRDFKSLDPEYRRAKEVASLAVLLHALDMMAGAGVSPKDAAEGLRAGKTIDEVCKTKKFPGCVCDPALRVNDKCDTRAGIMRCHGSITQWQRGKDIPISPDV